MSGLAADPNTAHIIAKYGGAERLQKLILCDFFKHGFDGSGSDGGSCNKCMCVRERERERMYVSVCMYACMCVCVCMHM